MSYLRACAAVLSLLCLLPSAAQARATFRMLESGTGFKDRTPAEPVGGNPGRTLGEQRRLALQYAFELWGRELDSVVPIEVGVDFTEAGCGTMTTMLGATRVMDLFGGLRSEGANPALFYPSALANSLEGRDLDADRPDIRITLNASIDGECSDHGFYYGFDAHPGEAVDLVEVVLHEVAHGLGFASFVNPETGALEHAGELDPFTAKLRDLDQNRTWAELDRNARQRSATNVRRVAWDGPLATRMVPMSFARGTPSLRFDRVVAGYAGFVSDTDFGARGPAALSGQIVVGNGCDVTAPGLPGTPWLAFLPGCSPGKAAAAAHAAGAAAGILSGRAIYDQPALPLEADDPSLSVPIPLLTLSPFDAQSVHFALRSAPLTAQLSFDDARYLGASQDAKPLMFTSQPVDPGSSISHLDPSVRPNQLMEPIAAPQPSHDLSFTRAMLLDLGWQSRCGNGQVDAGEDCDHGPMNDDARPGACRSDCRAAHCGDGVKDEGEACDAGRNNSDARPDACRTDCRAWRCGDGVVDMNEQCDRGDDNSDRTRGSCRTNCRNASCGDGVVDALEQCDEGRDNDDARANACRKDCRAAYCGDGTVDSGEDCDEARRNGSAASSCRRDCTRARCGDGIVDHAESCDGSAGCPTGCGAEASPPETSKTTEVPETPPTVDQDDASPRAVETSDKQGCGCAVTKPSPAEDTSALLLMLACGGLYLRRRP